MTFQSEEQLNKLTDEQISFVLEYCKDLNLRRAAIAAGFEPDNAYELLVDETVGAAVQSVLQAQRRPQGLDKNWLLAALYENHLLARQTGNINASNAALKMMAQHVNIDAFASAKLDITKSDQDKVAALMRARKRQQEHKQHLNRKLPAKNDNSMSFL